MEGYVFCAHSRMTVSPQQFSGTEAKICYEYHGNGLSEGDVVYGALVVVVNGSETEIPFTAKTVRKTLSSSLGAIDDLDDFTDLARNFREEAYRLYKSPDFSILLHRADDGISSLYRLLGGAAGGREAMEEFLVGCGKKKQVRFTLNEQELTIPKKDCDETQMLTLSRQEWGTIALTVTSDHPGVIPEKTRITDDDFIGSYCTVPFVIKKDALHAGRNYAGIRIAGLHQTEEARICIHEEESSLIFQDGHLTGYRGEKQNLQIQLCSSYLNYRLNRISKHDYIEKSLTCITRLSCKGEEEQWRMLCQAHLLMQKGDHPAIDRLLHDFLEQTHRKDTAVYAYYLYLTLLDVKDESYTQKTIRRIQEIAHAHQDNLWLILILLACDPELTRNENRRLLLIREKIKAGLYSPLLYLEAYEIYERNPFLLTETDDTQRMVLGFAARRHLISQELAGQIARISSRIHDFHMVWYQILQECYQVSPTDAILQAIVSFLIRTNHVSPKYFLWFHLAIRADLPVAGLYEAWLHSLDRKELVEIPQAVLYYFQYQNEMDYRIQSYFYACIWKNRQKQEALYSAYRDKMAQFCKEQLFLGHIDENLVLLYREFFGHRTLTQAEAEELTHLLSAWQIRISDKQAVRLIAERKEEAEPKLLVPSIDRSQAGSREESHKEAYFVSAEIHQGKAILVPVREDGFIVAENREKLLYLPDSADLVRCRLLSAKDFELPERNDVKKQDATEQPLSSYRYGYEKERISELLLFAGEQIANAAEEKDDRLLLLCMEIFWRGTYSREVLAYLVRHFAGSLALEEQIWLAAGKFELDTHDLETRFLSRLVFCEGESRYMEEIFCHYLSESGNGMIVAACFTYFAWRYLYPELPVSEKVLSAMAQQLLCGTDLTDLCRLAVTKYLGQKAAKSEPEKNLLSELLENQLKAGYGFDWYHSFTKEIKQKYHLSEKVYLTWRADPGTDVSLSYRIFREDTMIEENSIPMKEAYAGLFTAQLVLFCREKVTYSILENGEQKDADFLTVDSATEMPGRTRYELLNEICESQIHQNREQEERLITVYEAYENAAKKLPIQKG